MLIPDVFLLLPESSPCNQWMKTNEHIQDESAIVTYLKELENALLHLSFEEFDGFYDVENIKNCLDHFDVLSDYYPHPIKRVLYGLIHSFYDWRSNKIHSIEKEYKIHNQSITDHTFCESAEHNLKIPRKSSVILNIDAHYLGSSFEMSVGEQPTRIKSIENIIDISNWFKMERLPMRNFQVTIKHGENKDHSRKESNAIISPLRCSEDDAHVLLSTAIGNTKKELFNFDKDNNRYIIFKWEGETPQNMYHGYHVELDSDEIPTNIRKILAERQAYREQ